MLKKLTLAASVLAIGLGTVTPAFAGGSYGKHHFRHGHYGGHFKYRHRGHHGHGAAYALLGFGLGYMLYSASRPRYNYYRDPYYRAPAYYYPPRYSAPRTYSAPPPQSAPQQSRADQEFPPGTNCLQTREYTTVITIAGEEKEAYGTACLQPDGSWIAGAPKIVPTFD